MNKGDHISDEQLNAFTDNELDAAEKGDILSLSEESAELDARLCQQRKLKEMMQHAYEDVPAPKQPLAGKVLKPRSFGWAAVLALCLVSGAMIGWVASTVTGGYPMGNAQLDGQGAAVVASADRYLLHITSGEPDEMKAALQRATALLEQDNGGTPTRLEIVANEGGLDLLRSDITPFADEVAYLANRDVVFYACTKAIERLEEKGITVRLVPEANAGYTALDRVVTRLQDNWKYIKI
jgi:intracellular sulfur oxidation DsrE/DsrF family protein